MQKTNSIKSFVPLLLASVAVLTNSSVAKAVNFNFTYAPGTTLEQRVGFEMAGQIWSSYLTDDFTTNIYVETTNQLPENVIGGALPGIEAEEEYKKYRENLAADITSRNDWIADLSLEYRKGSHDKMYAMINGNEVKDIERLNLTRANAKAVDLLSDSDNDKLDGYILMSDLSNTSVDWNYDFLNGNISDNRLDYLSVALHEVGHIMGFVSGVDDSDWLNVVTESIFEDEEIKKDKAKMFQPLDLFRYSDESAAAGMIDVSIGGNRYFSINRGWTNLGNFATGQATGFGGDGYQASHWQRQTNALGIMDPVLSVGQKREITDLDLTAFDVIGYDANDPGVLNLTNIYQTAVNNANLASVIDRTKDVEKMIDKSETYQGRRRGTRWQEGFWQEAYFSEFSWQTINLEADSQAVPEPGTTAGFLAMGFFGLSTLLKRKKK